MNASGYQFDTVVSILLVPLLAGIHSRCCFFFFFVSRITQKVRAFFCKIWRIGWLKAREELIIFWKLFRTHSRYFIYLVIRIGMFKWDLETSYSAVQEGLVWCNCSSPVTPWCQFQCGEAEMCSAKCHVVYSVSTHTHTFNGPLSGTT